MIWVNIAIEDALSESILERLLAETGKSFSINTRYNRGGYGYLKRMTPGFNNASRTIPFIVLTDLDANECPASLLQDWLQHPKNQNFLFRVAIREVEAWLLADRKGFAKYLGISEVLVPNDAERIPNAKEALIGLAARSRKRKLREAIVPAIRSTARIGPNYNGALQNFVKTHWDVETASNNANSLYRCLTRLSGL
jgi:hypothetical protein